MPTKVYYLVLLLFVVSCKTTKSYLKDAEVYASQGKHCQAAELLYEANPIKKNKIFVQNALNAYSIRCIQDKMKAVQQEFASTNEQLDVLVKLHSMCNDIEQEIYILRNRTEQKGMTSTLTWTTEYATIKTTLYNAITEKIYKQAVAFYTNQSYEQALQLFTAVNNRQLNYKETINYREKCFNAITEKKYNHAIELYTTQQYEEADKAFAEVITRQAGYKEALVYQQKAYTAYTNELYTKALQNYANATTPTQFEEVLSQLDYVMTRTRYGQEAYKESGSLHKKWYNELTELYYTIAVKDYEQANYVSDFERVLSQFSAIEKRTRYSNISYKETRQFQRKCIETITAIWYKHSVSLMKKQQWENAFNAFATVIERADNYNGDTYKLQRFCYNEWTKEFVVAATSLYNQRKFRQAIRAYANIRSRNHYQEAIEESYLAGYIQACYRYGRKLFFFDDRNSYEIPELLPLTTRVKNAFRDDFIGFINEQTAYANTIKIHVKYTYGGFQHKNSPERSSFLNDIYEIKSYEITDTTCCKDTKITMYYSEPITYYQLKGTKRVTCVGFYSMGIASREDNLPNAFGNTVEAHDTDEVNYYMTDNSAVNVRRLTRQHVPKSQALRNMSIDNELTELFTRTKRTFNDESAMKEKTRILVLQQLEKAIIESIQQIQRNIE